MLIKGIDYDILDIVVIGCLSFILIPLCILLIIPFLIGLMVAKSGIGEKILDIIE